MEPVTGGTTRGERVRLLHGSSIFLEVRFAIRIHVSPDFDAEPRACAGGLAVLGGAGRAVSPGGINIEAGSHEANTPAIFFRRCG